MSAVAAAPNMSTFDTATPHRPGTDDFEGAACVDDSLEPPVAGDMPTAGCWNTNCRTLVGVGAVVDNAVVSVTGSATAPLVNGFRAAPSAVVLSTFTIARNGAGDVSITWPANTFPSASCQPSVSLNSTVAGRCNAVNITNGVRVRCFDASGTAADLDFTVRIP